MTKLEKTIKGTECCRDMQCTSCPYNIDWEKRYCITNLCRDALEMLRERQWVRVKDRLPEHGQTVLAWEVSGFVYVDNYDEEHDVFRIAYNNCGTVTHWMPLPEPPKEE